MNDCVTVLDLARRRGVALTVADGQVEAEPASALTDGLRSAIRANRPDLLAVLSADDPTLADQAAELTDRLRHRPEIGARMAFAMAREIGACKLEPQLRAERDRARPRKRHDHLRQATTTRGTRPTLALALYSEWITRTS